METDAMVAFATYFHGVPSVFFFLLVLPLKYSGSNLALKLILPLLVKNKASHQPAI
jgi:hypothetical protein